MDSPTAKDAWDNKENIVILKDSVNGKFLLRERKTDSSLYTIDLFAGVSLCRYTVD